MVHRQQVSSGATWEPVHGYARAVRIGDIVAVSGTVGVRTDGTVAPDIYSQTTRALAIIGQALDDLGLGVQHVIRTRVFLTDIAQFAEVARAHREVFGQIRPASTIVEVRRLLDDAFLVEIEADAVVPEDMSSV